MKSRAYVKLRVYCVIIMQFKTKRVDIFKQAKSVLVWFLVFIYKRYH